MSLDGTWRDKCDAASRDLIATGAVHSSPALLPYKPPVVVLYAHDHAWEYEFLMKELFLTTFTVRTIFYDGEGFNLDQLVAQTNTESEGGRLPIIMVVRSVGEGGCQRQTDFARRVRPTVAVLLADEYRGGRCLHDWFGSHPEFVRLVLRQYSWQKHEFKNYSTVHNIVLGHMPGTFKLHFHRSQLKAASDRSLVWSFFGAYKNDRKEMENELRHLNPRQTRFPTHDGEQAVAPWMGEQYQRSQFVPIGRGNAVLDCFRIYEASRAGAIPVIVGPEKELHETFSHFVGHPDAMPPWLFAQSWKEAAQLMSKMKSEPRQLNDVQTKVLDFFDDEVRAARRAMLVEVAAYCPPLT